MGTFPIQYSQKLPPAVGPNVRANLDVSTGTGAIAQGIEALGGAFEKIADAQTVMEFSKLKRSFDEMSYAAFNAYSTAADETARQMVVKKWDEDVGRIQSKDPRANKRFQIHLNEVLPHWGQNFANQELAIQAKQVDDDFEIDQQQLLESGNVKEAAKQIMTYSKLRPLKMSQADAENRINNLPNNMRLARARIEIDRDPEKAIAILDALDNPTAEQLDEKDKLKRMAQQKSAINTDQIENEIVFGMFDNKDKTLVEKEKLGQSYINKLRTTSGLSAEAARVMTTRVENWMTGKARINDSLVYTKLFRDVTQLHRGIGKADEVRREIRDSFDNLDDGHFESLNKYLDETVEEWNADTLRRLEKEAIPHLAPRLAMIEKWMEMAATPGISAKEKAKYDSLIERLQEPAKVDADRLALYLNQSRKWIAANPTAPNFYENGRRIMAQFERYTDDQIRQMEKQLETEGLEVNAKDQFGFTMGEEKMVNGKNYKYIGNNQWQKF